MRSVKQMRLMLQRLEGEKEELTKLILAYQQDGRDRSLVLKRVYLIAYCLPVAYRLIEYEQASEFLIYVSPSLERCIDRFSYQGRPFWNYLVKTLRCKVKSYHAKQNEHRRKEAAVLPYLIETEPFSQDAVQEELRSGEAAPAYALLERAQASVNANQLLYLSLLCSHCLSGAQREALYQRYVSYQLDFHQLCIDIDTLTIHRKENYQRLSEKRDLLFSSLLSCEKAAKEAIDEKQRQEAESSCADLRERLSDLVSKMNSICLSVSHKQLSAMLGIPKGTIDSGVFYLKKKYRSLLDE